MNSLGVLLLPSVVFAQLFGEKYLGARVIATICLLITTAHGLLKRSPQRLDPGLGLDLALG